MKLNSSNYKTYLERMTHSFEITSKRCITSYVQGKTLDVGCGSGALLAQLEDGYGIDLNPAAVTLCRANNLRAEEVALKDVNDSFDTIIFSSVLHEFSSYDDVNRFSTFPIVDGLRDVYSKLNDNGIIIIRDGLKGANEKITLEAKDEEVIKAIYKYREDCPQYNNVNIVVDGLKVTAPAYFLKEFGFTYTWGSASYPREVQEMFGILTKEDWKDVIEHSGFEIEVFDAYAEEYCYYISRFFKLSEELTNLFKESVIFIVARKK